jgi:hypothetical protein
MPQLGRTAGYLITLLVPLIVSVWGGGGGAQVKVSARQQTVLSDVFVVFLVVLKKISGYI